MGQRKDMVILHTPGACSTLDAAPSLAGLTDRCRYYLVRTGLRRFDTSSSDRAADGMAMGTANFATIHGYSSATLRRG